jgi:serine/threonine protein kinase
MERRAGGSPSKPPLPPADEGTQLIDDVVSTPPASPRAAKVERTAAFGDHEDAAAAFLADMDVTHAEPGATPPQALAQTEPGDNDAGEPTEVAGAPKPSAHVAKGGKITALGDFRLLKKLGEGGMGAVYKAQDVHLDRIVAIKVLAKHLVNNPAYVQRFQREAKVMAKLDHVHVVRCYKFGTDHGMHYLAIEFIDGGSMQGVMDKRGKLSVGDALHVALACAHALHEAHSLNLIHRDIKPDNVLLTSKGVVKVADLGLAKATDENVSLTQTGTGAGTPLYMAPEQFRDAKHVDGRTDIYALGVMLYYFLTGEAPFKGETYVEVLEAKEKGKFAPARTFNDEVPERLDLYIDKMLARDPKHRYLNCAELIQDLEGLAVANESLSFIETTVGGTNKPVVRAAATPQAAPPTRAFAPPPPDPVEPGIYYVQLKTREGKKTTRKVTEKEVLGLIRDSQVEAATQISKTLKAGYRDLATYREFEPHLRGQMMKARTDRKAEAFKSMYEKIEKEQESYERWRFFRRIGQQMTSGLGLLLWLAAIGALCVVAYFGIKYGLGWLGSKAETLTK